MKHDGSEHKGPLYYKSNISEWVVGQCGFFGGVFLVIILWKYKKKTNKLWAWRL